MEQHHAFRGVTERFELLQNLEVHHPRTRGHVATHGFFAASLLKFGNEQLFLFLEILLFLDPPPILEELFFRYGPPSFPLSAIPCLPHPSVTTAEETSQRGACAA
ncbi:MAG: hypothetical protein E6I75_28875 [Chloroflexi bacterium]|nr:MAG: hypothetical protein E6I75_28875 [Chloroflexota bacterium]